jgi:hypothetical protein
MSYVTQNILTDAGGKPIPQYWDGAAFQPMGNLVVVSPTGVQSSASFTRPSNATPYAAGAVVCNSVGSPAVMQFPSIGTAGQLINIYEAIMTIANNVVPTGCAGYRLYLYTSLPAAIADAAAYNLPAGADLAKFAGWIDLGIPSLLTSNAASDNNNINKQIKLASTTLYGILTCKGAETPASGKVYNIILNTGGVV